MNNWNDIEKKIVEDSEKLGMTFQEGYWEEMEHMLDENDEDIASAALFGSSGLSSGDEGLFQEEYWDEMSLILDKEDRRRRRALWLRWTFDAAAILLLMFTVFNHEVAPVEINKNHQEFAASTERLNETPTEKIEENTAITPLELVTETEEDQTIIKPESSLAQNTPFKVNNSTPKSSIKLEKSSKPENTLQQGFSKQTSGFAPLSLPTISLNSPEIVRSESLDGFKNKPRRNRMLPISVNLTASSNLALAPEGNISNPSRIGSNSSFGIEVLKHQVNWSLSLGTKFSHKTGLNHELLRTNATYGARLYREYQSVKYNSIGSIGIPVGVNYHRKRSVFGIRLTPTWNVMVNSTYHRYNNYNSDELLVNNNYGIKEGINPFDLSLKLMYQRRLTENLAVGVNVSTGFFNQIDPNMITDSKGMKEFSVGLNVQYTIFKR